MTKIYTKEITSCFDCPKFDAKLYNNSAQERKYCLESHGYIHADLSKVSFPEWCPLPNKS